MQAIHFHPIKRGIHRRYSSECAAKILAQYYTNDAHETDRKCKFFTVNFEAKVGGCRRPVGGEGIVKKYTTAMIGHDGANANQGARDKCNPE